MPEKKRDIQPPIDVTQPPKTVPSKMLVLPKPEGRRTAMKGTRHSEEQIIAILKQVEVGLAMGELCRQHGISEQTYYRWKAKYGGMENADVMRCSSKAISLHEDVHPRCTRSASVTTPSQRMLEWIWTVRQNCLAMEHRGEIMTTLTVTAKGQVTLKRDLLRHLGVSPGEKIEADKLPDGRLVVKAATQNGTISDFVGCLSKPGGLTIKEVNEIAHRGWARRK
jgi:bifunctional DNA-binding transcriptional regulator/antitoxin component of YhaV-PrlF toxin-antitoxin module